MEKIVFNVYSTILVIIFTVFYLLNIEFSTIISLFFYGVQFIFQFFIIRKQSSNEIQIASPYIILLLGLSIVNFQVIIDTEIFNFPTYFDDFFLTQYIKPCLYLGIIAQITLSLGYVNYIPKFKKTYKQAFFSNKNILSIILFLSFIFFIVNIDIYEFFIGNIHRGGADREIGTMSKYSEQLLKGILVIYISEYSLRIKISNNTSWKIFFKNLGILFWIVFIGYLFLCLVSGDRGPIIYNIMILYFGFVYAVKFKLSYKFSIIIIIVGSFTLTLLGMGRKMSTELSFIDKISNATEVYELSDQYSFSPSTREMAGSGKLLPIALRGTTKEDNIDFGYGLYELNSITPAIPFMGRAMQSIFPNLSDYSTSEVLTICVLGNDYSYGLGSSAIAEAYMDLDFIGIYIIFIIFGIIYKKINICIIKSIIVSKYYLTFCLYMSGYAIYIGRASFVYVFACAVSTVIIQWLVNLIPIKKKYL